MVRGGPAGLGHFVHSSHTSPDETQSSHGFLTRMMPVDTGTNRRTHGMCRRTYGITWSTHGIARISHGSARKSPKDPRNAPVEPGSAKSGVYRRSTRMFQTVSNIRRRIRIEPELPGTHRYSPVLKGSTTDLPRRSTDYPRTTQDQTGVARIGGPWRSGTRSGKV